MTPAHPPPEDPIRTLTEAKDFAEAIVETLHEPLLVLHADLTIKSANPAFYDWFKVTPEETLGKKIYDLGNGQWNIPSLRTLLDDVLPHNNVFNDYEVNHEFETIGRRVMLVNARRLDHVQLILLGIRDITEREESGEALRKSEARLTTMLEALPVGVVIADADGRLMRHNAAFRDLWGMVPETTSWQDYGDFVAWWPETGERINAEEWAMARALRDGETTRNELILNQKFGSHKKRYYLNNVAPIRDDNGAIIGAVAALLDVTEHRAAQQALHRSEERCRLLVENAREYAIFMTNRAGEIVYWSSGAERITGYSEDEVLNRSASVIFTDEDRLAKVPERKMDIATREGSASDDRWHQRKDGSRFWASGVMTALRDNGELRGFAKVIRDNTARKRHEEHMALVMAELNHRVKNTLAVVQSIARQTARRAADVETFSKNFVERLQSMAKAHDLLTKSQWMGAVLREVIENEISGRVASETQCTITGPSIYLQPKQALAMHMVIHELTTNAAKYGGLKSHQGRIDISWTVQNDDDNPQVELHWRELAPHTVSEPAGTGYGSRLIDQLLSYELGGGRVERDFRSEGLHCRITFPLPTRDDTDGATA